MGVKGLWELIHPVGRPVTLESLEGKVLAIDVSLWLHQAVRGFRDCHGNPLPNAHLLGLFHRICKLLHYRIKPIFVFDGGVPELKKQVLAARRQRKTVASNESEKTAQKLLRNLMKQHAVKKALGKDTEESMASISNVQQKSKEQDIFMLPPITTTTLQQDEDDEVYEDHEKSVEFQDLNKVDIESEDFKNLPPEMQHEILSDIKQTRKENSWYKMNQMPQESDKFSSFQLSKILHQNKLTKQIKTVENDINMKTSGAAASHLGIEGGRSGSEITASRIMSHDASHYILIKGMQSSETETKMEEYSMSSDSDNDTDLKSAMAMSMNQPSGNETHTETDTCSQQSEDVSIDLTGTLSGETEKHQQETDYKQHITTLPQSKSTSITSQSSHKHEVKPNISTQGDTEGDTIHQSVINKASASELANLISDGDNDIQEVSEPLYSSLTESNTKQLHSQAEEEGTKSDMETSSDDDEGFLEVEFEADNIQPDDELFPASIFNIQTSENIVTNIPVPLPPTCTDKVINEKSMEIVESDIIKEADKIVELSVEGDKKNSLAAEFSGISQVDLEAMEMNIEIENENLQQARGKQERLAANITDQMYIEAQDLLKLFGIPYVVSPMEAEAQCAELDRMGQIDGCITDDSDIWLFGALKVYKNFFNQNKLVEQYKAADIEKTMGIDRSKLVCIALVSGSDYTDGVQGAGPVTALEILTEFGGKDIESLRQFKEWWDRTTNKTKKVHESKIKGQLRLLKVKEGFPNQVVVDMYLNPTVDTSSEDFSWGVPDLDLIRQFAHERFGWNRNKVDEMVLPVMKKLSERQQQPRIDKYFSTNLTERHGIKSKRTKRAFNKLLHKEDHETTNEDTNEKRKKQAVQVLNETKSKRGKSDKKLTRKTSTRLSASKLNKEVNLSEESSQSDMDDDQLVACAIEVENNLIAETGISSSIVKQCKSGKTGSKKGKKLI